MIPTRFKAKLPKTLSYPLGAEAISTALAGAPHADAMTLSFHAQAVWPARVFQRLIREGQPYRVLEVEYQPPWKPGLIAPNAGIQAGWYECHWTITVYPVLRELRHTANQLLREYGLPAVVGWLRRSEQIGWGTRQHKIEIEFKPADRTLTIHHEDGV